MIKAQAKNVKMDHVNDYPGFLSDNDIRFFWGNGIEIFTNENNELAFNLDKQLQFGSIDLHFRHECKRINLRNTDVLTYKMVEKHEYTTPFELKQGEKLRLRPGEIILTTTLETVRISEDFAGIITGRSSIARLGVMVHCCQAFINPGHGQPIPLQIVNLGPSAVELDLNVPICQIVFVKLRTPASGKYIYGKNGKLPKYANEVGPQNSKIYEESSDADYADNRTDEASGVRMNNIRKSLSVYVLPFLPSLIMLMLITPFINNRVDSKVFLDVVSSVANMPLTAFISVSLIALYVWIKRGE